jgi:hypothetical protein
MKHSPLQPLLDLVASFYQTEKEIARYIQGIRADLPDGLQLSFVLRAAEDNKTHCDKLEGLIAILNMNLARKLSPTEAAKCAAYCSELLRRFRSKHGMTEYDKVLKDAGIIARQETVGTKLDVSTVCFQE